MVTIRQPADIALRPWSEGDFELLQRLMGDPLMTEHLGGPEPADKLRSRHERYLGRGKPFVGAMLVIVIGPQRTAAGSIGYWEREWHGNQVWESGWSVLTEFQGRGVATRALLLTIARARLECGRRYLHAFPSVDNPASNAACRKAGLTRLGECDFEFPIGHWMRCNDWRFNMLVE